MRRGASLAFLVVACASLVAVAATPAPAASSPRTPLRGTNWELTDRVSLGTPLDGVAVNAVFGATRVEGSSGCNGYSNSYTTNGSRMRVKDDGVSTMIACPGAAGKVETAYRDALVRVGRYRVDGTTLTLSTRAGRRLLVYRAATGTDALRGAWEVTGFYTGTAISSPIVGTTLSLEFAARQDQVSGNGGCNSFSGPFVTRGRDAITIGPLASTMRACADPAVDTQEQQYLAALGLARTWRVTGGTLTLLRDGGAIAVSAQRAN